MASIVREVLSLKIDHRRENRTKLIDHLKDSNRIFDRTDYLLNPVRDHDQFMNDLPKVIERLHVKAQTVYSVFLKEKTEIVNYQFGDNLYKLEITYKL